MTENEERFEELKDSVCRLVCIAEDAICREGFEELDNAGAEIIGYLEEIQQYRAIGTVEEFEALKKIHSDCSIKHLTGECSYNETGCSGCKGREIIKTAVERMKPRKVIHKKGSCYALAKDGTRAYEIIQECPNCHSIALKYSYPCRCGQVLDWSE